MLLNFLSQSTGGGPAPDPNALPPTSATDPYYLNENTWKFGCMLCYGMTTYTGDDRVSVNSVLPAPSIDTFAAPINIENKAYGWVSDIEGVIDPDFYVILAGHITGFTLFPTTTPSIPPQTVNDASLGRVTLPQIDNYHTQTDHVGAFVQACKDIGKPVFVYFNMSFDFNVRGSLYYGENDWYIEYKTNQFKEIIQRYDPYGMWCDSPQLFTGDETVIPSAEYLAFYRALKAIKPDVRLAYNSNQNVLGLNSFYTSGGEFIGFPKDAAAREANISDTNEWSTLADYQGTRYYINSEKVQEMGSTPGQAYLGDNIPLRTLTDVQNTYTQFTGYGARYCLAVTPNRNGDIPSDQLTLLDGLTL